MSEYMVDVGLNLQSDGYITSMGQAINLTKQYADVAQGLPGQVQNLSKSMVGATMSLTGFNKVNGVALDTAASYEKQLSRVEATSKITGQSFDKLAKTTKGWARDFPIGIGEATKVMETLQKQGISSEKQMATLGKSFIKLGAATGTSAAGMGAEFLQLSRTFGNGIGQFQKLSDSLVTTTAKMGGSAPAVVAFSKALAPVASTVGLSQTAVTGLSTAMSKLGEDGYQAANSFNKVLLDMNKAMRDGGPELKAYADLLGTTQDSLKSMFSSDPAEVLAKFSDAVAKQGPNITRTLDALGFDSVRTTRSLTALARSGGPREAIATAVGAYGDGSTEKAAAAALDGLSDQSEKLRETMGQVVSDVGQPLLGFAKTALMPVNAVASGVKAVTGSSVGQAVLGGAGVGGAVMGMAGNVVTAATVASLGAMAINYFKNTNFAKDFSAGKAAGAAGFPSSPAGRGPGAALGYARSVGMSSLYGLGVNNNQGSGAALGKAANRLAGFATEGAARYQAATANMFRALLPGMPKTGITPEMAALRQGMSTTFKDLTNSVKNMDSGGARTAFGTLRGQLSAYGKTYDVGAGRGVANMAAQTAMLPVRAGAALGAGALRAGGAALSAVGMTPLGAGIMGGVIAAGAGTMAIMKSKNATDEALDNAREANSDIYSKFNDFSEATGQAGKGVVAFTAQIKETTQAVMQANKTYKDAYEITSKELSFANKPGYESAMEFAGENRTASGLAGAVISTLGPSASQVDISRAITDLLAEQGTVAYEVKDILQEFYGSDGVATKGMDYKALQKDLATNDDWLSRFLMNPNATQVELAGEATTFAAVKGAQAAEKYGGSLSYTSGGVEGEINADEATRLLEAKRLVNSIDPNADPSTRGAIESSFANMLGLTEEELSAITGGNFWKGNSATKKQGENTWDAFLKASPEYSAKYAALESSGTSITDEGVITYGSQFASSLPEDQKALRTYFKSFSDTAGVTDTLAAAMTDLTDVVLTSENALARTAPGKQPGLAQIGAGDTALLAYSKDQSSSQKRQAAVESILDRLVKSAGGNFAEAKAAASYAEAQAGVGTAAKDALGGVLEQLDIKRNMENSGRSKILDLLDTYKVGKQAEAAPVSSATSQINTSMQLEGNIAKTAMTDQMASFNRAWGSMQAQIVGARRSAGVSIGQVQAQSAMQQRQATEDYDLNKEYQREDFKLSKQRNRRDFNKSLGRNRRDFDISQDQAQEDYTINRERSIKAFNLQETRMNEDHNKSLARAQADFNTGKERANRDYNLSVSRANRDFNLNQTRATEDFNRNQLRVTADYQKSRTRMVEDYNKQLTRLTEDSARSMYDPFKRIQAQMVMDAGQLVSNLKDQTEALQKQLGNLSEARALGLSDQAIKALNLADASNAQQLSRLVGDLAGNTNLVDQINEAVGAKATATSSLMQDTGNVQFQRMAEDFNTQMSRGEEDFATASMRAAEDFALSSSRSAADFRTQMSDAATDFKTQMGDSDKDFALSTTRMKEDFKVASERMRDDFKLSLDHMAEDFERMSVRAKDAFKRQMADAINDFQTSVSDADYDFSKMEDRAAAAFTKAISRMKESAALQIAGIGAQTAAAITSMEESFFGMFQNTGQDDDAAKLFKRIVESSIVPLYLMSDDIQAMYTAATEILTGNKTDKKAPTFDESMKPWMQTLKANAGTQETDDGTQLKYPAAAYDEGQKTTIKDLGKKDTMANEVSSKYEEIGKQAGKGFIKGVGEAIGDWWDGFWQGLYDAVNIKFEIHSPSKKFEKIGENVVDGFVNGVKKIPSTLWDVLTEHLPTTAEMKSAVVGVFSTTKEWFESFIGEDSPIKKWIGKGWETLWSTLPKPADLFKKIKNVFEGEKDGESFMSFLTGIPDWIAKHLPSASTLLNKLDPIKDAFSALFYNIVDLWNKLELKLSVDFDGFDLPPVGKIEVAGKTIFPGFGGAKNLGKFSVHTPDLFPNITNPFPAPKINQALGGIVTKAHTALIGEAGYPEAVIPLNQRGADVLAATMARYVDKSDVQASSMERYATPTYNYYSTTQDYSTQFNGEITVQAQNPDDMAIKLASRARRQALAQPIRGQR